MTLQILLPFFPAGATIINKNLGVQKKGEIVYYFNGPMPIFQHPISDYSSFRLITSQMVVNGNCKQMEIVRCFGVSKISVKRWVKKYREQGAGAFYQKKTPNVNQYLPMK